jgi:hypothetical protein
MTKPVLSCGEISLPHDQMVILQKSGKLNLGMDNALAAKISAARIPLKMSVSAAFNFWGLIALGIAAYSIYLSFTGSWWWFIPGLITAGAILKSNDSGNAKSVLHSAMADPAFYERVRKMNGWVYQIGEQDAASYRIG